MGVFVKWLNGRLLRDYTWSKMSTYDLVKCWRRIVCKKRDKECARSGWENREDREDGDEVEMREDG